MRSYVYKITNSINGKWYIGKRRHKNPYEDDYMGSGKLIKLAIKKYGKDNFTKEIIDIFDTDEEAALLESILVTKESLCSMSYNMHEGGLGGFAHLNDGGISHKERCKKASSLVKNRHKIIDEGIEYRFNSETSLIARKIKNKDMEINPEKYQNIYKRISEYQKENNSMKNKCWCVPKDSVYLSGDMEDFYSKRKAFIKTDIPDGWISLNAFRDSKKRKSGVYGRYWIHDPVSQKNKYHQGDNIPDGWHKGRKTEYYQRDVD